MLACCCLQNLVDSLAQHFQEAVPSERHSELNTFVVYNQRSRVTSSAKRKRPPGSLKIHQTPDGSFLDLMRNARHMLLRCSCQVPQVLILTPPYPPAALALPASLNTSMHRLPPINSTMKGYKAVNTDASFLSAAMLEGFAQPFGHLACPVLPVKHSKGLQPACIRLRQALESDQWYTWGATVL